MDPDRDGDPRVRRTRDALCRALSELLRDRAWDDIRVQDLCRRARVGRSTFYARYGDLDDLIAAEFEALRVRSRSRTAWPSAGLVLARRLVQEASAAHPLLRALVDRRSGHVLRRRFCEMLVRGIEDDLGCADPPGERREAVVHVIAGAFMELFTWWLQNHMALPEEELLRLLERVAEPYAGQAPESAPPPARTVGRPGGPRRRGRDQARPRASAEGSLVHRGGPG